MSNSWLPNEGLWVLTKTSTSWFYNVGLTYNEVYGHDWEMSDLYPENSFPGYERQSIDFNTPAVLGLGKAESIADQVEFTCTGVPPGNPTALEIQARTFFLGTYGYIFEIPLLDKWGTAAGGIDEPEMMFSSPGDTYKVTITHNLKEGHI